MSRGIVTSERLNGVEWDSSLDSALEGNALVLRIHIVWMLL